MSTVETRLDRIEALLERHIIQSAADRQQAERDRQTFQSNFTAITEQAERDRKQATQDRETTRAVVRELVENAEADRLALLDSITENREKIDTLTQRFDRFVEQAAADRQQAAIDRQQFQRSISELTQQFQTETRRIWEYLYLLQGRNGNTPQ
jgi:predicted RNase H-like nuclease (RuvC/YqgF family)